MSCWVSTVLRCVRSEGVLLHICRGTCSLLWCRQPTLWSLKPKALYVCNKNWNFHKALEAFHKVWQRVLGDLIAVVLEGTVRCEVKCARTVLREAGFRCWLNFTCKVCVRSGQVCSLLMAGALRAPIMEGNVWTPTLVQSLINGNDFWVRIVGFTAAVVELPSSLHLLGFIRLASRNPCDLGSGGCISCSPSYGAHRTQSCKEASFSGFDLLLRISLSGERACK